MQRLVFCQRSCDNCHSRESGNPQSCYYGFRITCGMTRLRIPLNRIRFLKTIVFAVGLVAILTNGCGQQESPGVKQTRAIAAENIELRKQVERLSREIDRLEEQHEKDIEKQEKLLTQCRQDKESWKKKARQNIRSQVEPVLDAVIDETAQLREENIKLKAQIEQIQKKTEQNKSPDR